MRARPLLLLLLLATACADDLSPSIARWADTQQKMAAHLQRLWLMPPARLAVVRGSIIEFDEDCARHRAAVAEAMKTGKRATVDAAIDRAVQELDADVALIDIRAANALKRAVPTRTED